MHIANLEKSSLSRILKCSSYSFTTPMPETRGSCPCTSTKGRKKDQNED